MLFLVRFTFDYSNDSIFFENDRYSMERYSIVGGESIHGNESRKMYHFNC